MPPIQALLEWFPDRRGLASGAVISGFGCGALVFSPAVSHLSTAFASQPTYLGAAIDTITHEGRFFTVDGGLEVVHASAMELANLPYSGLQEGFYLVGSGNTGVPAALTALGVIYMAAIACCTAAIRRPPPGYLPPGFIQSDTAVSNSSVHVDTVMKTPQFYLMFGTAVLLGTGGMGLIAVAKPMVSEIFSAALPAVVTPSFASAYLLALAGGNLFGRLLWAAASDKIGRRNMFHIFAVGNAVTFAAMPTLIEGAVTSSPSSSLYLGAFCASSVATLSVMGGTYACMPAYEADLWGPKYVQAIHGYFLVAPSVATIVGPAVLLNLRRRAEDRAMAELLSLVDPVKFKDAFGAGIDSAGALAEAKTLTVAKLYQLLPPGTVADPLPLLYHDTLYAMAALAGAAAALHFAVGPVDRKYFERAENETVVKPNDNNNKKSK